MSGVYSLRPCSAGYTLQFPAVAREKPASKGGSLLEEDARNLHAGKSRDLRALDSASPSAHRVCGLMVLGSRRGGRPGQRPLQDYSLFFRRKTAKADAPLQPQEANLVPAPGPLNLPGRGHSQAC